MPTTKTMQSVESISPSYNAQPAPSSASPAGAENLAPLPVLQDDPAVRRELETLRRQVVALQRISSLGVLAGGVFHELNNALTPILAYAKLGLRNSRPGLSRPGPHEILDAASAPATITGGCSPYPAGPRPRSSLGRSI